MRIILMYEERKNKDCLVNLECEECGTTLSGELGHNTKHYKEKTVPGRKCPKCGKSTNDLKNSNQEPETT